MEHCGGLGTRIVQGWVNSMAGIYDEIQAPHDIYILSSMIIQVSKTAKKTCLSAINNQHKKSDESHPANTNQ